MRIFSDKNISTGLLLLTSSSMLILTAIGVFVITQGISIFLEIGLTDVLLGTKWDPREQSFGLLPMIIGSTCVTVGALMLSVPLGIGSGIFIAEIAPQPLDDIIRIAVFLLAGIPPVVYGFLGLTILVPVIRIYTKSSGFGIPAASAMLALMILPTIIATTDDSLHSVSTEYREAALACSGVSRWQMIQHVVLPLARREVVAGVLLGMARSLGETTIVLMVSGNVATIPSSLLSPVRTLSGNIALEMAYSVGQHRQALFATSIVLLGFVMLFNLLVRVVNHRT